MIGPYSLAFPNSKTLGLVILENFINILFTIDIALNFFSAYLDENFAIIDDYKVIKYLMSYLLVNCCPVSLYMAVSRFDCYHSLRAIHRKKQRK
jgi:hypothetical protein